MKINVKNWEKLAAALDAVQGKCRERRQSVADIQEKAAELEARLERAGLAKKDWPGCSFVWQYYDTPPRRYKYPFMGTRVGFERTAGGWFVTNLRRDYADEQNYVVFTEAQEKIICQHAIKTGFNARPVLVMQEG